MRKGLPIKAGMEAGAARVLVSTIHSLMVEPGALAERGCGCSRQ
jgi:hypothetical protein